MRRIYLFYVAFFFAIMLSLAVYMAGLLIYIDLSFLAVVALAHVLLMDDKLTDKNEQTNDK